MKKILALTLVLVMVAGCGAPTLKLGLGMVGNTSITAAGEKDGKTQVDATGCAVALDANGKIVNVSWDVLVLQSPKLRKTSSPRKSLALTMA